MAEAKYWSRQQDGKILCSLCPNACAIARGRHGTCRVRFAGENGMEIPFYGMLSSIAVDPIEKKPLYHFHPGSRILSVGFVGCSFRCRFCQNHHISQTTDVPTRFHSPEDLVDIAVQNGSFGIAYTYSEPLIHFEYVRDTSRLARKKGIKNVLVSNGYIQTAPAEELIPLIDAANIDLKSNNEEFYKSEIGGEPEEVKRFLRQATGRIHLEVTTLVIPTKNDSPAEIEEISRFISSLDPAIPFHLSCYYPQYKYTLPPTPPSTVQSLAEIARRHLSYVYLGNVGLEETNTYCPSCRNLLVRRVGYNVKVSGVSAGVCAGCGRSIPITGIA